MQQTEVLTATTAESAQDHGCRVTQQAVSDDFFRQNKQVRTLFTPQTAYFITHSRYNSAAVTTNVQPMRPGTLLGAQGNVQEEKDRLLTELSSRQQVLILVPMPKPQHCAPHTHTHTHTPGVAPPSRRAISPPEQDGMSAGQQQMHAPLLY